MIATCRVPFNTGSVTLAGFELEGAGFGGFVTAALEVGAAADVEVLRIGAIVPLG
jgi:hypothetical protein